MSEPVKSPADSAVDLGAEAPDRVLTGADQIANHFGLTKGQVYALKKSGAPIGKVPGLGLTARVAQLDQYFKDHGA